MSRQSNEDYAKLHSRSYLVGTVTPAEIERRSRCQCERKLAEQTTYRLDGLFVEEFTCVHCGRTISSKMS